MNVPKYWNGIHEHDRVEIVPPRNPPLLTMADLAHARAAWSKLLDKQLRDSIEQGIFAHGVTDEPPRRKKRRKARKPTPTLPTRRAMRLTGDLL